MKADKCLKFRLTIKDNRCWKIEGEKETEIENKWTDKWGSLGFTLWMASDWEKSGRNIFLNFHIRDGGNWNRFSHRHTPLKNLTLEVFYKWYNPNNEEFHYYKKYYSLGAGKGITRELEVDEVIIEFFEEDRVEKDRDTGHWKFINGKKKSINPTQE